MSIASRINEMTEHLRNDWNSIDKLGLDITEENSNDNLDKNIENITPVLDRFYNQSSDKTDLSKNGVIGRTSQESTTGKNAYNINVNYDWVGANTNYTITGNTINVNGKYFVAGLHSVKSNTNYTISAIRQIIQDNSTCGTIRAFTIDKSQMLGEGKTTFTFNTGNNSQIYVLLYAGLNQQGNIDFSNIQLEEGNSATNWEEYTGGEPSPNPDYPQEINNLSGDVEYKVSGKNLFDKSVERKNAYPIITYSSIGQPVEYYNSSATHSYVNSSYLEAGQEYTISWTQNATPVSTNDRVGVIVDDNNLALQKVLTWRHDLTYITFTPTDSGYLILASDINTTNIQIEPGTTATSYEPHISESFPLSLKSRNLFDSNSKIIENFINNSGMTYTLDNGIYTLNGTNTQRYIYLRYNVELEPGSYIFTGCPKGGSFTGYSCIVRVGTEPLFDYGDGISFTLTEKETVMVYPVRVGADSITVNNLQFKPMLEKVDNLFVGYDNMQSGFLPQSGSYPTTNSSNPNAKYQLIELKQGESVVTGGSTSVLGRIRCIDKSTNKVVNTIQTTENNYYTSTSNYTSDFVSGTITAKKDIILGVMILNSTFSSNFIISKISPYEPYYDIELCNISDYKDRIYSQNGKFYLEKKNGKVVLDGSENWGKHATTAADIYMIFIPNSIGYEYGSGKIAPAICNSFIARALGSFSDDTYGVFGITPSLQTRFFVGATGSHYANINAWKQYLSNNNMLVYFALATPTITEITQENYPTLYSQLLAIQEFLTKYKINKEFLLDYSSLEIEY